MSAQKRGNESISPTAWTIAQQRSLTDIPYSQQIFEILEKQLAKDGVVISDEFKSPQIAPQTEARYKLVDYLLRRAKVEQVLEIASGFSPRGLQMTDESQLAYVEVDLPEALRQKRQIIEAIGQRVNLHLMVGDALNLEILEEITEVLDPDKKLGIVHEGLLRYLTFDQKAQVARNIYELLTKFEGVWITPDITLKQVVQAENTVVEGNTDKVGKSIGINIDQNRFDDVEHAQRFFENLGFSVEKHRFMEVVDLLSSPKKLGQIKEQVEDLIGSAYVFVMRPM